MYKKHKDSKQQKQSEKEKTELENQSPTCDYTAKLLWPRQYSTGTNMEIYINEHDKSPEINP